MEAKELNRRFDIIKETSTPNNTGKGDDTGQITSWLELKC
jgi:hypothetical protein